MFHVPFRKLVVSAALVGVPLGCQQMGQQMSSGWGGGARSGQITSLEAEAIRLEQAGQFAEASEAYQELRQLDGKNVKYPHRLAVLAVRSGDSEAARTHFSEALAIDPDNHLLLTDLGVALYRQKSYSKAEQAFRQALAADSESIEPEEKQTLLNHLGVVLAVSGRTEESLAVFQQYLPPDEAHARVGATLAKNGKPEVATRHFAVASQITRDPEMKTALNKQIAALETAVNKPSAGQPATAKPEAATLVTGTRTADSDFEQMIAATPASQVKPSTTPNNTPVREPVFDFSADETPAATAAVTQPTPSATAPTTQAVPEDYAALFETEPSTPATGTPADTAFTPPTTSGHPFDGMTVSTNKPNPTPSTPPHGMAPTFPKTNPGAGVATIDLTSEPVSQPAPVAPTNSVASSPAVATTTSVTTPKTSPMPSGSPSAAVPKDDFLASLERDSSAETPWQSPASVEASALDHGHATSAVTAPQTDFEPEWVSQSDGAPSEPAVNTNTVASTEPLPAVDVGDVDPFATMNDPANAPTEQAITATEQPVTDEFLPDPVITPRATDPVQANYASESRPTGDAFPIETASWQPVRRRSRTVVDSGWKRMCPVSLRDRREKVTGRPEFQVIHHSRAYYFASPAEKARFEQNPERYVAVKNGVDLVRLKDEGVLEDGHLEHASWFGDKIYFFSSADSLKKFQQNPVHYAAE